MLPTLVDEDNTPWEGAKYYPKCAAIRPGLISEFFVGGLISRGIRSPGLISEQNVSSP